MISSSCDLEFYTPQYNCGSFSCDSVFCCALHWHSVLVMQLLLVQQLCLVMRAQLASLWAAWCSSGTHSLNSSMLMTLLSSWPCGWQTWHAKMRAFHRCLWYVVQMSAANHVRTNVFSPLLKAHLSNGVTSSKRFVSVTVKAVYTAHNQWWLLI